jgi:tetratricopeptide (TPR) repeat protein
MGEIINPYIAGAPVTEASMFFGREDVFDWIQNSLVGQFANHILVIHGQRRVGKTSVLKQLGNRLPERYIPVFFDLQGRTHTNLDRFLWWLAREIVRVLKQDRNIDVPQPDMEAFEKDMEYFENHFLPDLRPILGNHILLLTFDEFDNLEEREIKESLARPLVDYLRRLMVRQGLNFIFSIGSSGRKLENMQAAYTEFFKTALYKKISFLSEEQTHSLVMRPVEGVLEYEHDAVDRIYAIASGHPYFTQLICYELFARCQRTEQRKIARSDVEAVLDDVVERGTVNLKFVWDEASDIEKWGLAALAHLEEKADTPAVANFLRKQHLRFVESDLKSGLLHLREKDVLTPENCFVIYLLRLWLQKNRPIDQVREELTEVNPIANRYIEIGMEFKNAMSFDKASDSFLQALAVDPDNIQAQVNLGLVYMDQKAYDKAIVEFEKALKIDDEDVAARSGLCEAHLALGDSAMQKGRMKEAGQSYQRVLAINGEHTEARGRMAEIWSQRAEKALSDGRDDDAISAFVEALKFTPEDQSLVKRYEETKINKRTKLIAGMLARVEKERNAHNWEGALSVLNQAEKVDPGNKKVRQWLATIQAEQHQSQLAAILTRADRAKSSGRWSHVITALEEYLSLEQGDENVRQRLEESRNKIVANRLEEARSRAANLARLERFADALLVWEDLRQSHPELGKTIDNEIEKVKQAQIQAELNQENQQRSAIWERVERARETGRWEEAISALEEYLKLEPGDEKALQELEKARQRQVEKQVEDLQAKAHNLAHQEHFDEALAVWQELLVLAPDQEQTVRDESEQLQQNRLLAESYSEAQAALAKKSYDHAVSLLKKIIIQNENYKDASRLLMQAIELRRMRPKWWKSKWSWGVPVVLLAGALVWFGFRSGPGLVSSLGPRRITPTNVNSITGQEATSTGSTATQAITSTELTTPEASSTSKDPIMAFAQPILDEIENAPPDYSDDFSDPKSGWDIGITNTTAGKQERGYVNGEYFLRAPIMPPNIGNNGTNKPSPIYSDFVMTVDFRFMSGDGTACIDSRSMYADPNRVWYYICFSASGAYDIDKSSLVNSAPSIGFNLEHGHAYPFKTGLYTNKLKWIARGDQMAFFLNDKPLTIITVDTVSSGAFGFWMASDTSTPLEVRFDNFKVWIIASVEQAQLIPSTTTAAIGALTQPILNAVSNLPPDYAEYFSDSESGWPNDLNGTNNERGYRDGEYYISSNKHSGNVATCWSANPSSSPIFSDFVLELDVRFINPGTGSASVLFRYIENSVHYRAEILSDGLFSFLKNVQGTYVPLPQTENSIPIFNSVGVTNHLILIVYGNQMVAYINGELVSILSDSTSSQGTIYFQVCGEDHLQALFDNLKVWNITPQILSKVPSTTSAVQIREFADPILSAVADRKPDITDDFRNSNSGWPTGETPNGDNWGYVNGTYMISVTNQYRNPDGDPCLDKESTKQPQISDFVLEVDAQFASDFNDSWHFGFRQIPSTSPDEADNLYLLSIRPNGFASLNKGSFLIHEDPASPPFLKGKEINHLTFIAQGTLVAIYANGDPYVLMYDPIWQNGRISLFFGVCNNATENSPLQAQLSNLKVWDITKY